MEWFDTFKETIFLKEDSLMEKQLEELKQVRNQVIEQDKIEKDIKLLEYGLTGEKSIAFELKNSNLGMYVLHDVAVEFEDYKAQIDFIVVTKGHVYLIESKNLVGNITVDSKGEFRREYSLNGKSVKEAIYSPYTQAQRHKEIIMKKWFAKHNKLEHLLYEKYARNLYKPLIVLSNSSGLLNIKYAPKEIRDCTIRVDQLLSYIEKDIKRHDKNDLNNRKGMYSLAQCFVSEVSYNNSFLERYTLKKDDDVIEKTSEKNKSLLEAELRIFRKERAREKNIPAYYIFTDAELEKILLCDICSLEDLKNSKILSNIKVKLHGREIVEVIKRNL